MNDDRAAALPSAWPSQPVITNPRATIAATRLTGALGLRLAQLGLVGGTALLYLWNLGASGWANAYYSAAALAGSQDWLAFLFGSFDAGNALTVDKTPAALWVMSLSVRLFGLSSWSVLVPEALMGVASVWVLYLTVRRAVGHLGGLVAGATLALTPVAALMFRFNNPDALLVLLLVVAAYATTRAVDRASARWLAIAGVAVGFAFLAKMLQAFLVIPAFSLVYLVAAPTTMPRRLVHVAGAAAAVLVSGGWFIALVELWPANARPFIGGSQTNSLLDLLFGYNGFGRLTGDEVGRIGGGGPFSDGAGWLRLFQGELATEASWLLPTALIVLVTVLIARWRAARTDSIRAQAILWGGWLLGTGLTFSLMQGIFHEYYTVALAPAIGALVGLGVALAWRNRGSLAVALAAAAIVAVSAGWTVILLNGVPGWNSWLTPLVIGLAGLAVAALVAGPSLAGPVRASALAASLVVLLAVPAVGSIATAAQPHTGAIPIAEPQTAAGGPGGPGGRGGVGGPQAVRNLPNGGQVPAFGDGTTRPFGPGGGAPGGGRPGGLGGLLDAATAPSPLVAALAQDADQYTWTAATTGSNNAAGLALSSKTSVMSIGGFNGTDPAPTLEKFQALVAKGAIHYYVAGNDAAGFRGAQGGSDVAAQIAAWVESTFSPTTIGGVTVYDLTQS
jgi:4-amino-4-deoxy-L-arabinose transferase-like glycosyltransferase